MNRKDTVRIFCEHCDWAHQCWLLRKHLYDENPDEELLRLPHYIHFFTRLEKILQEYWIHEVAKLLDPAKQNGFENLSIENIFRNTEWTPDVRKKLIKLKSILNNFGNIVKPARNKLLSHKDKNVILAGKALGAFKEGEDVVFFDALRDYANEVHMAVVGEPFLFDDLTKNDIGVFMSTFSRGIAPL